MRASNQDRERVAAVLQHAMAEGRITIAELESRLDSAYAVKTIAELDPITVDLPGYGVSLSKGPLAVVPQTYSAVPTVPRGPSTAALVGVMSQAVRKGLWVAPRNITAVALMGGVELDFTGAQLSGMETVINAAAIMGSVEITVPESITVIVDGIGIMGSFEDNAHQSYGPDQPVLRVRGLALMGAVEVKSRRRPIEP